MALPKTIIYADDDPDDIQDIRLMLRDIDPSLLLITFSNGLELMRYIGSLRKPEEFPCCIMLDINMPVWDGIRTLQALKNEKQYGDIPVIIFSTSTSEKDKQLASLHGANSFITKPTHHEEWVAAKRALSAYFAEFCII